MIDLMKKRKRIDMRFLARQQRDMYLDIICRWNNFFADLPHRITEKYFDTINEIALDYCESPEFISFVRLMEENNVK